ncbi:hypothetical protein Xind_03970 [Xenorhabdus indica]|nr:hypothetical protein [Xenorhabdus indica]
MDGDFGDAVHVHQTGLLNRVMSNPGGQHRQVQCLPAKDNTTQGMCRVILRRDKLAESTGGLVQHGHTFLTQQRIERLRGAGTDRRDDNQLATVRQGAPYLPYREIKSK